MKASSLNPLVPSSSPTLVSLDNFLLASAMGALGLTTQFSAIKNAELKPLLLAAVVFFWLVFGGVSINIIATALWNW